MKKSAVWVFSILFIILPLCSFAQSEPPQHVTIDGRLFEPGSSTEPLLDSSVNIRIQVLNPLKNCILYEEQQTVSTLSTIGYFNIQLGSIVGDPKRTGLDSLNTMKDVFYNRLMAVIGKTSAGGGCSYTPTAMESRYFRFFITPSTAGTTSQLSPDMLVDSVPQAIVAQTLQGLGPSDVFRTSGTSTQAKLDNLFSTSYSDLANLIAGTSTDYLHNNADGTQLPAPPVDPGTPAEGQLWYNTTSNQIKFYDGSTIQTLGVAGSGITSLNAGSGLDGGTITTAGTISISSGGVTNAMLATGIDASKITLNTLPAGVVPTGTDTTKLPLIGGTLTGALTLGDATNFASFDLLNLGHITMTNQRTFRFGQFDNTQQTTLLGTPLTAGQAGTTWYNTDTGKLMYWNGTQTLEVADTTTAGGDINAVSTNAGSGLSGGAITGPVILQIETDNTGIEINGFNQLQLKDLGVTTAKLAANSVTSTKIVDSTIATADLADSSVTNQKINTVSPTKIVAGPAEYLTYQPAAGACTNGQTLKWNSLTGWECGTDIDTNTDAVSSVFTRTGSVTAQGGDYTATQITNTASGNIAAVTAQAAINELDSEKVAKSGDTVSGALILNGILTTNAAFTTTSSVTLNAQNEMRFADSDSSNYVALRSPATIGANITWTLPTADGLNGTVLTTNGSGVLTWSAPGAATSVNASTGTAAAPSISFTTEADTGFYNSNSNSIGVASGGFQTFEFNSTGLQSPNARGPLVAIATGSAANPTYSFSDDPTTGWFSPAADTLAAATNGSERVRIDSSGNVGIGTTSPVSKLDVSESVNNSALTSFRDNSLVQIANRDITSGSSAFVRTEVGLDGYQFGTVYNANEDVDFVIRHETTANSVDLTRFIIKHDGKIGIGTTAPSKELEVNADSPIIRLTSNDTALSNKEIASEIQFYASDASNVGVGARIFTEGDGSTGILSLGFEVGTSGGILNRSLQLDSSGRVGIGTSNPQNILHVVGGSDVILSSGGFLQLGTTESTNLVLDDNEIQARSNGAASPVYIQRSGGTAEIGASYIVMNEGQGAVNTGPDIRFNTSGLVSADSSLYFNFDGAGIGTGDLFIGKGTQTSGATKLMTVLNNGNIGIGTTAPAEKLQVVGDIRVGVSGVDGCLKDFSGGTIAGTCSSDARLKRNFRLLGPVSDKLLKISPKFYQWRSDEFPEKHFGDQEELGLVAQDLLEVIPELVRIDDEGFYRVRYQQIPFYLIKGFAEQQEEIKHIDIKYSREISLLHNKIENLTIENVHIRQESIAMRSDYTQIKAQSEGLQKQNRRLQERLDAIEKTLKIR